MRSTITECPSPCETQGACAAAVFLPPPRPLLPLLRLLAQRPPDALAPLACRGVLSGHKYWFIVGGRYATRGTFSLTFNVVVSARGGSAWARGDHASQADASRLTCGAAASYNWCMQPYPLGDTFLNPVPLGSVAAVSTQGNVSQMADNYQPKCNYMGDTRADQVRAD